MGIIQKRADELKPGDVVIHEAYEDQQSVVVQARDVGAACIEYVSSGMVGGEPQTSRDRLRTHVLVKVESPDLTPAQQHADQLVLYAKHLLADVQGKPQARGPHYEENLLELLAEIEPPEPPTLEEALEALASLVADGVEPVNVKRRMSNACALLDRARRAGILKP